jgi:DNA-binding NtrC family response regulator
MNLSDFLQDCGFRVLEASSGAEAVAILSSDRCKVDLVFSDIRMPGDLNGLGLAKWIRENRSGLPVVLASGDATKSEVAHELCSDHHFFAKPYDLDLVVKHIRATLGPRASQ